MEKKSICVLGSGKWGDAIARVVGENAIKLADVEDRVNMFVFEEVRLEPKVVPLISTLRKPNIRPPEIKLPDNVIVLSDLVETARYADIIICVTRYETIPHFCEKLLGKIKPNAVAISLTTGFAPDESGGLKLASQSITKCLKIPCAVLTGANLASVLARNAYCEATLSCRDGKSSKFFADIFNTDNFRVILIDDADCLEVCGFLKHILAFGSGILDGFDCIPNTISAFFRFGFMEMIRFVDIFYPGCRLSTFFECCGLADVITVSKGSRNRRVGETLVRSKLSLEEVELEILGGEKLLSSAILSAVMVMLKTKGLENTFPLFSTIYAIMYNKVKPEELLDCLRNIPNTIYHPQNTFPL